MVVDTSFVVVEGNIVVAFLVEDTLVVLEEIVMLELKDNLVIDR